MDYETLSSFLLSKFFLSDWERTWLEGRFELGDEDFSIWNSFLQKYPILLKEKNENNFINY